MENQMIISAKKVFGLSESEAMASIKGLQNAPIVLVEHTGLLPGEGKREHDQRRELIDVYTGGIKSLVKHLTSLNKSLVQGKLPWEIIFTYYKMINPDEFKDTGYEETVDATESMVATVALADEVAASPTAADETEREIKSVPQLTPVESPATTTKMETPTVTAEVEVIEQPVRETLTVGANKVSQVTAKCDTKMEVHEMNGENTNLEGLAEQFAKDMPTEATPTPETKESKDSKDTKKAKPARVDQGVSDVIANEFQSSMDARFAFIRDNHITCLIAAAPSIRSRLVVTQGIKGKLAVPGNSTKEGVVAEKIAAKINGLVKKATGGRALSYEEWLKLSDEDKYSHVVDGPISEANPMTHKEMAKKMIELAVACQQNEAMDVDLAAPATDNVSYKGLVIGGNNYAVKELTSLIIDNAPDSIFGEGMIGADGSYTEAAKDKDRRVEVKLVIRDNNTESKGTQVVSTQVTQITYKPVTVLRGRKALIETGKVKYLKPEVDKEDVRTASLTVLIDGQPASFKYYKVDKDGKNVTVGSGEKAHDATMMASLKGCGAVYSVVNDIPEEYIAGMTLKTACSRWDLAVPAEDKDASIFERDFDALTVFDMVTRQNMVYGDIAAETVKKANSILNAKKAAEAADAAETLGA